MFSRPQAPVSCYFCGLAELYNRYRPGYPPQAIHAILEGYPIPARAADIGCGSGICSRLLAETGAQVIGIDPNPEMLAQARRHGSAVTGSIEYHLGSGEQTGLADASVDVVVCAQSFHWFDEPAALREFHRILRPNGRLALIWNIKDDSDPFTRGFTRTAERAQSAAARTGMIVHPDRAADPTLRGFFTNARRLAFQNDQLLDLSGLLGRARSASYFPRSGPLQDELEADLRRLFDRFQRRGQVELCYRTELTLAQGADRPQGESLRHE